MPRNITGLIDGEFDEIDVDNIDINNVDFVDSNGALRVSSIAERNASGGVTLLNDLLIGSGVNIGNFANQLNNIYISDKLIWKPSSYSFEHYYDSGGSATYIFQGGVSPSYTTHLVIDPITSSLKTQNVLPLADGSYSIGSSSTRYTDIYGESFNLDASGNNISYIKGASTAGIHFSANNSDLSIGKVEYVQSNKRMYIRGTNTDGSDTDGVYLHLSGFVRWHTTVHQWPSNHQALDLGASTLQYRNIYCVSLIESSDPRMKNTVNDLDSKSVNFINNLKPKSYKFNNGNSGRYHVGFLSTEVKQALDTAGFDGATQGLWVKAQRDLEDNHDITDGVESLRYSQFIGHIVKYIQNLNARINQLES